MEPRPARNIGILRKIITEEAAEWHFNPLLGTKDYWKVGNIRQTVGGHWDKLVDFAFDLDQLVDRTSAFDYPLEGDDTIVRLTSMGYEESSTRLYRTFSDLFPNIFGPA